MTLKALTPGTAGGFLYIRRAPGDRSLRGRAIGFAFLSGLYPEIPLMMPTNQRMTGMNHVRQSTSF